MQPAPIEQLPPPTRHLLRSTQILTSLCQIVSELVQNSLDAGAHNIQVGIDCEEWTCWVRDDGSGMTKEDMKVIGTDSEDRRYGSSKAYSPDSLNALSTFGFRGEALASAADICCLEISSRTANSRESWSVILKGGKNLYTGPSIRWRRESQGTAVCIRDAFFNLPVRRLSHPSTPRTLESIRQELEAFALVFPHVSFTFENTHGAQLGSSSKESILRIPKTTSSLATFRHLYGRALAQHVEEVELKSGEMKLDGFIGLEGAHSKAYQFLYINRHPISTSDLHRIIDARFASSSFAKHAFDELGETSLPRSTVRRSPRKTEKKAIYVLNLTIPHQQIDNCLEPAKAMVHLQDRNAVVSFLSSSIDSFLSRHGFSTRPSHEAPKRRKYDIEEGDSGYAEWDEYDEPPPTPIFTHPSRPHSPLYIRDSADDESEVLWTDPNTGQVFVVDNRTGNSFPWAEPPPAHEDGPVTSQRRQRRTASLGQIASHSNEKPPIPEWIQQALEANDVYVATENKIPALALSSAHTSEDPGVNAAWAHGCHGHGSSQPHVEPGNNSSHRFQKADLRGAQIINQVDRKFIACLIDDTVDEQTSPDIRASARERALVLIDQHAADERIRVERFLKELCVGFLNNLEHGEGPNMVQVRELSPSIPVLLTRHEAWRLGKSDGIRREFKDWGFVFDDTEGTWDSDGGMDAGSSSGYTQVLVRSIPEVVADKLLAGDELRDLIKGFLARLDAHPTTKRDAAPNLDEDQFYWLKALRWCPQELIDLINSKACRGAIMFNDSLTISQCEKLVRQLSDTAFPFQCAHGRPSLVPLASVVKQQASRRNGSVLRWSRFDADTE